MHLLKVEDLIDQWAEDSVIDKKDADTDLLNIPVLHSKYAAQFVYHNIAQKKKKVEYDKLYKAKLEYYTGDFSKQDYDDREWAVFSKKLSSREQLNSYLAADDDLNKIRAELSTHDDAMEFCQMVVEQIKARTYQIRSYLEWSKYKLGA